MKHGGIVAVGSRNAVMKHEGRYAEVVDLSGHALLPGFVDSHGHVFMGGMEALLANLLAPWRPAVRSSTAST